jgi:RNA polymerase sigma-70 factor (ECF subfamily)
MPLDDLRPKAAIAAGIEARAAFDRYRQRLIGLARIHLGSRLQRKVDPEDVVQSAYKSLLIRYGNSVGGLEGWDRLWGLLTLITIRKCADRAHYHQAGCRNLEREAESASLWREAAGREPTPDEAIVLAETIEGLLSGLCGDERAIVQLSLQGYSTQEISQQIGRAERTVRRLREQLRKQLEKQRAAAVSKSP